MMTRPGHVDGIRHLIVCVADHFEPFQGGDNVDFARAQVARWQAALPRICKAASDSGGTHAKHTFFYPQEDYDPDILNPLAELCHHSQGEVEVHLHHHNDTPEGLREKLVIFRDDLHEKHGLLGTDSTGRPRYAFIHGNWALCNAHPEGIHCGVDAELGILEETGCFVDMTFPSAPSPTQARMVNTIYYARDLAEGSRSADGGVPAQVGRTETPGLLLIPGPLALNWGRRKYGVLPRLENGDLTGVNPPTLNRLRLWGRQWIHVAGRPEWVFVKVHTHGCDPRNMNALLADGLSNLHRMLEAHFTTKNKWAYHYVTAREMANIVWAAEHGSTGDPSSYRDYRIRPPS
ncbi:MAG: hypothetical protein O3C57_05170 [Verrucomicrobia bacterium]|nr:hypothetical protein [Verrucomicrobiota bacterium]